MIAQLVPAARVTARSALCARCYTTRSRSIPRPYGSLLAAGAVVGALAWGSSAVLLDSRVDVEKEQREDPDGVPSGAKGSKRSGAVSKIDKKQDERGAALRVEGVEVGVGGDSAAAGGVGSYLSLADVGKHNLSQDAWVIVDGKVFDVSEYHKHHPGGSKIIVANAGRDVTEIFRPLHPPGVLEANLPPDSFKGLVDPEAVAESRKAYEAEQDRLAKGRAALPAVESMLSLDELEDAAKSFLSPRAANYYSASSLDGISTAENLNSFRKCRLVPRVMRDVSSVSPQTTIFGIPSALPIYVSPSSNALLGHPDGELNIVRGASKTGIVQGISAASSFPLTEILEEKDTMDEETGRKMGMVYQVYLRRDRSKTEALVEEALEGGCQALILTVDSNVGDLRQSTEKMKGSTYSAEPGAKFGPFEDGGFYHDARQNWSDLARLKELAGDVPIYLKGISHIDDVRLAKKHNLAGVILSNHGGRQLDRARTGFDSLRSIAAADPALVRSIEVYVDGGVRRGSDVLQAVALGAKGVGLGRPFLYSQAAYGEKGVIRTVRILESEIVTAMRLLGVTKLSEVKPEMIECLQEVWK